MKKRKTIGMLILFVLLVAGVFAVILYNKTRIIIGKSQLYREEEIQEAMDIVVSYFDKEFTGCKLRELKYDEEESNEFCGDWAMQYEADKAIIFTSRFVVDSSGGDGSFEPGSICENWQWILTQNDGEEWVLQTYGY